MMMAMTTPIMAIVMAKDAADACDDNMTMMMALVMTMTNPDT